MGGVSTAGWPVVSNRLCRRRTSRTPISTGMLRKVGSLSHPTLWSTLVAILSHVFHTKLSWKAPGTDGCWDLALRFLNHIATGKPTAAAFVTRLNRRFMCRSS